MTNTEIKQKIRYVKGILQDVPTGSAHKFNADDVYYVKLAIEKLRSALEGMERRYEIERVSTWRNR